MKTSYKLAIPTLAALLLAGCASSRRMMRISPLAEVTDELASTSRTNAWPIYYHDKDEHSVLWPLVDWDKSGFAFRPLYNREGDDKSILFPLSGWNKTNKDGWVLTGYWDKKKHGIFPLYRHYPGRFSHYTLFWTDGDDARGIFPFFGYDDDFRHLFNVFWSTDKDAEEFGLFPFYFHQKNETLIPLVYKRENYGHCSEYSLFMGLLAKYQKDKNRTYSHVLPFWLSEEKTNGSYLKMFLPFYWNRGNENTGFDSKVVFPFFYRQSLADSKGTYTLLGHNFESGNKKSFAVYPLYFQGTNPRKDYKMLLPFYYRQIVDGETLWVTPLCGFSSDASGKHKFANILGPVYINREHGEYHYKSFLWPFYMAEGDKSFSSSRLLPFYNHYQDQNVKRRLFLGGLGKAETRKDGTGWRMWPFCSYYPFEPTNNNLFDFTLYGKRSWKSGKHENWLFPFYYGAGDINSSDHKLLLNLGRHYRTTAAGKTTFRTRFWPLFSVRNTQAEEDFWDDFLFFVFDKYDYALNRRNGWSVLGDLGFSHRSYFNTGCAKSSFSNHFLLFGSKRQENYSEKQIPDDLRVSHQKTVKTEEFDFLCFESNEFHFKLWKKDALTHEDMSMIHSWIYRNGCYSNSAKVQPSVSSFGTKTGSYFPHHKLSDVQLTDNIKKILLSKGVACTSNDKKDILAALHKLANQNSRVKVEKTSSFWPFYDYAHSEGNYQLKSLFGLFRSKKYGDRERTSFLKYLYRSERDGDNIRRDIFPFISIDSGENCGHSFLGKLWNFRKGKDGRYGNILFIPWGTHPED